MIYIGGPMKRFVLFALFICFVLSGLFFSGCASKKVEPLVYSNVCSQTRRLSTIDNEDLISLVGFNPKEKLKKLDSRLFNPTSVGREQLISDLYSSNFRLQDSEFDYLFVIDDKHVGTIMVIDPQKQAMFISPPYADESVLNEIDYNWYQIKVFTKITFDDCIQWVYNGENYLVGKKLSLNDYSGLAIGDNIQKFTEIEPNTYSKLDLYYGDYSEKDFLKCIGNYDELMSQKGNNYATKSYYKVLSDGVLVVCYDKDTNMITNIEKFEYGKVPENINIKTNVAIKAIFG